MSRLAIRGQPLVELVDRAPGSTDFSITRAIVAPARGMMLLQASGRIPSLGEVDLVHAPPLAEAASRLDAGGPDDFAGNLAFAFGGAILLPYANRIRGAALADPGEIETFVGDRRVRLPRNWGGRAPGAERYAMHGLLLDRAPERLSQPAANKVHAQFDLGGFGGRWPSRTRAEVDWRLESGRLRLRVHVANIGEAALPIGVGWHPYFKLASGDRSQARLHHLATQRLVVNNYDEVLPTGAASPVRGTAYDFAGPAGAALGELYLDDCFTGFPAGDVAVALLDPAAGFGVVLEASAPPVSAVQVYAPPDHPFVVLEPQTNWADPFGSEWAGRPPPIPILSPGEALTYEVVTRLRPA